MHFSFIAEAASLVRQIQTWKSTFWKHPDKWYVTMAFWTPSHLVSFVLLRGKAEHKAMGHPGLQIIRSEYKASRM